MSNTYTRTVKVPVKRLTATKSGKINRAMKDYRRAREYVIEYFKRGGDALDFTYSEREDLRKRLSGHDEIELPSRMLYPAITTVEQNFAEYEKGGFESPPTATRVNTLGLEGQNTRLFHADGCYYLNVATGRGNVNIPLRVSDDDYHAQRFPDPDAVPDKESKYQRRAGKQFAEIPAEAFPNGVVKLSTSRLQKYGTRQFVAHLVFQHKTKANQEPKGAPDFVVGVDRGRNEVAYAALYDVADDHVVDWAHRNGDDIEHYMDEYADRIAEFQQAGVWDRMEKARKRRLRYKRQIDYEVANTIIDLANGRLGSVVIVLEDLSSLSNLGGYALESRRFNEWSYYRLKQAIADKAKPYGVPVEEVSPNFTSQHCSRCGGSDTVRSGVHFTCRECGYEQHADANAAVNIAKRGADAV